TLSPNPSLLGRAARVRRQSAMVAGRGNVLSLKPFRPFLRAAACSCIDDAATRYRLKHLEYLPALVLRVEDRPGEIRSVEAGDDGLGGLEREALLNVAAHVGRGRCGHRDGRRMAEEFACFRDLEVARPKIVA